jgi:hypothetical protein
MGYCIELLDSEFEIKGEHFEKLKKAFKELDKYNKLAWVPINFSSNTLKEVFSSLRYKVKFSVDDEDDECISGIAFTGEKAGDDNLIWDTIAPFVTSGSFLEFLGEDGDRWRVIFVNGTWKELQAKVSWE